MAIVRAMEPTKSDVPAPRHPRISGSAGSSRRGRGQVRAIARAAGRGCSRPHCDTPAAATLVFSYREQVARLVDLLDDPEPQTYDLCPAHADRTSPPRGWELADARPVRSDAPRRLDDDETVAVIAAALRGETPPARVSVVEGGLGEDPDSGDPASPRADDATGTTDDAVAVDETSTDTAGDDPLRAALEELQRVALPDDDAAVAAAPATLLRPDDERDVAASEPATAVDGEPDGDPTLW